MDLDSGTPCTACDLGTFADTGATMCPDCVPGTTDEDSDPGTACTNCIPGQHSIRKTISCTDCGAGEYNDDAPSVPCKTCPVGHFSALQSTSCIQCVAGTNDDDSNASTVCVNCAPGTHAFPGSSGANGCAQCSAGQFDDDLVHILSASTPCVVCPLGKIQNMTNQLHCDDCSMGRYQDSTGQVICKDCLAGLYLDSYAAVSSSQCAQCIAGKYSEFVARDDVSDCIGCVAGKYATTPGRSEANDCIDCVAGKYVESTGNNASTDCIDCVAGTWISSTGNAFLTDCIDCASGKYSTRVGSLVVLDCRDCVAGKWVTVTGSDESTDCISCLPGKSVGVTGSDDISDCADCAIGTVAVSTGFTECVPCALGRYQGSLGQTHCIDCDVGTSRDALGGGNCTNCAAGTFQRTVAQVACTLCQPGEFSLPGSSNCTSCPFGSNDHDSDPATACQLCSPGDYAPSGSTTCPACEPGQYDIDGRPATLCVLCASGKCQPLAGQLACNDCSAGRFQNENGRATCLPCPGGVCPTDTDCSGDWAPCNSNCESLFTVFQQTVGNGATCAHSHGELRPRQCDPGEAACPLDTDCVGDWTTCDVVCTKTFDITVPQSGTGQDCVSSYGELASCLSGVGLCPLGSCIGHFSDCLAPLQLPDGRSENCSDKIYTVTQAKVGDSADCPATDGSAEVCLPGEGACPPDIDCVGTWQECGADCIKLYDIAVSVSGRGAVCPSAHGDVLGCSPGEDSCALDINCLGTWSRCLPSCSNKTYTMTRPSSGNGAACPHEAGASGFCSPNEGDCAANVDCVGSWAVCNDACERAFTVHISSSGTGVACNVSDGFTEICTAETPCNDNDDQTMRDKCDASRQCAGEVVLGAQLVYSIDASTLPPPDSPDRVALDASISLNLATVMSAGGMVCTASDIEIMSIGGGSVVIDYNVAVPPAFATPALMASARAAIADPSSVGVPGSSMVITVGGVPSGVPQAMHFKSYAWVQSLGVCPGQCGSPPSTVADTYSCEEDGIVVDNALCETYFAPILVSDTQCPPTDDCACVGAWSVCLVDCSDKVYTITRPEFGFVGNGQPCPSATGDVATCSPGEGQCPSARDCIGAWSPCSATCTAQYSVYVPVLGAGVPCVGQTGDTTVCPADALCDDGDATSMGDTCNAAMECRGRTVLGASLSYAMDVAAVPAPLSPERVALDTQLSGGLEAILTASGLPCTAQDINIISIVGGSLVVDFSASVPSDAVTPQAMVAAQGGIEDPATVGLSASMMSITINGQSSGAPTAMHFKSYAWVRTRGSCPTACGIPSGTVVDMYACEEDGVVVDSALCVAIVSPALASVSQCPPTADCPCLPALHCHVGATTCNPEGHQTCAQCVQGFHVDDTGLCTACPVQPNCIAVACAATACTWNAIQWACTEGLGIAGQPFHTVCLACLPGYRIDGAGVSKHDEFCIGTKNFVSETRNCVLKTKDFVFQMMNFAVCGDWLCRGSCRHP